MTEMAAIFGKESDAEGGNAKFEVVDGAGHFPMVERAREWAAAVRGFLDDFQGMGG